MFHVQSLSKTRKPISSNFNGTPENQSLERRSQPMDYVIKSGRKRSISKNTSFKNSLMIEQGSIVDNN